MTATLYSLALALAAACVALAQPPAADFFVSPGGNDAWSGTLTMPNAAGSDGPDQHHA